MFKVLVTGVNGFVGKHLVRELARQDCDVDGVGREEAISPDIKDAIANWFTCDLAVRDEVNELDFSGYDAIISLAGLANVGQSFEQAELYNRINVDVLANICERLLAQKLNPRIIAVSTGAVYDSSQPMPLTEISILITRGSPYALSKIAMEKAAIDFRNKGLNECIIVRPFNHIGPGQNEGFLVPDLYKKIKKSAKSGATLKTGNLTTRRDYTDVRDVVKAYAELALAKELQYEIYNVCSGKSIAGEKVLKTLLTATNTLGKFKIEQDPALIRPNDPPNLFGSNERLSEDTGWQPQIPFEQTIADFVASQKS